MNEKTPSGKNGQRGFEYTGEFLTRAGEFLPIFLLALFFVVVDFAFLLSSSSKKKKSTTTLWEEETFFSQSREF